jgi:hypothetical protein
VNGNKTHLNFSNYDHYVQSRTVGNAVLQECVSNIVLVHKTGDVALLTTTEIKIPKVVRKSMSTINGRGKEIDGETWV